MRGIKSLKIGHDMPCPSGLLDYGAGLVQHVTPGNRLVFRVKEIKAGCKIRLKGSGKHARPDRSGVRFR